MQNVKTILKFLSDNNYFIDVLAIEATSMIRLKHWKDKPLKTHQEFLALVEHEFGTTTDLQFISQQEFKHNIERLTQLNANNDMISLYNSLLGTNELSQIAEVIRVSQQIVG